MFYFCAQTQMDALLEQALMVSSSVTDLLENKVVLIVPQGNPAGIESFEGCSQGRYHRNEKYQAFRWDSIQKRYSRIWESGIR